jgi:hypothetical protein
MATKTINGAYPGGFVLGDVYSGLTLTASASVGGTGVYVAGTASVLNEGSIAAGDARSDAGVYFREGGQVTNAFGGHITGYDGVASTVTRPVVVNIFNDGAITGSHAGVSVSAGTVVNGGLPDTGARIQGYKGVILGAGTVLN